MSLIAKRLDSLLFLRKKILHSASLISDAGTAVKIVYSVAACGLNTFNMPMCRYLVVLDKYEVQKGKLYFRETARTQYPLNMKEARRLARLFAQNTVTPLTLPEVIFDLKRNYWPPEIALFECVEKSKHRTSPSRVRLNGLFT